MKIDLPGIELAFGGPDLECAYYLNLESGDLLMVTQEMQSAFEELSEQAETAGIDFAEALAASDLPDWMKEAVAQVAVVEEGNGTAVIEVPRDPSDDAYRDMEAFAESVGEDAIRRQLMDALSGGRPFRHFKNAIAAYPREEQRWFDVRDARLRQRVLAWLEEEGIEPID